MHLLAGSGPFNVNLNARMLLISKLSARQLIKYRRVIPEWRDTINQMLETRVTTLLLFNDAANVRAYKYFIEKTAYDEDLNYIISANSHSFPNLALCVSDIEKVVRSPLLDRMKAVKRLVFFGDATLKNSEPEVTYHESWHAHLHKFMQRLKGLESVVVHHWGYYDDYFSFESNFHFYKHLRSVHLVQPGLYVLHKIKEAQNLIELMGGYRYDRPLNLPVKSYEEDPKSGERVVFYVHALVAWGPSHQATEQAGEHLLEEYPLVKFRF